MQTGVIVQHRRELMQLLVAKKPCASIDFTVDRT